MAMTNHSNTTDHPRATESGDPLPMRSALIRDELVSRFGEDEWVALFRQDPGGYVDRYARYVLDEELSPAAGFEVVIDILVTASVHQAQQEILRDVVSGRLEARDIEIFADLHEYVDANEYGGLTEDWAKPIADGDFAAMVQERVHVWIRDRHMHAAAADLTRRTPPAEPAGTRLLTALRRGIPHEFPNVSAVPLEGGREGEALRLALQVTAAPLPLDAHLIDISVRDLGDPTARCEVFTRIGQQIATVSIDGASPAVTVALVAVLVQTYVLGTTEATS